MEEYSEAVWAKLEVRKLEETVGRPATGLATSDPTLPWWLSSSESICVTVVTLVVVRLGWAWPRSRVREVVRRMVWPLRSTLTWLGAAVGTAGATAGCPGLVSVMVASELSDPLEASVCCCFSLSSFVREDMDAGVLEGVDSNGGVQYRQWLAHS